MTKKIKFTYAAVMVLLVAGAILEAHFECYYAAGIFVLSVVWLLLCYKQARIICEYDKALGESIAREMIAKKLNAELRERVQKAEQDYQALLADTPARGAKGRFTKRENTKNE